MNDITAVILTKNEEKNIVRCIDSVKELADRIVVVDSGSTDDTVNKAIQLGAEVFTHPFKHYADQFNWALDNTGITTTWVYRIDADEAMTPELRTEVLRECREHNNDDVNGFLMKHKICFLNKFLTHGGTYPFIKMTVFKSKHARFDDRAMGEHVVLDSGEIRSFKNDCIHYDFKDLTAFIDKHNGDSTREAEDHLSAGSGIDSAELYEQARKTRKLRDGLYYRLPPFFRAKLYYWYRYYIRLGFLDGKPGKIYALIQAYFYRVMVDAKIYEAEHDR